MHPNIEITFVDASRDRALEGAIHRWVARVEGMGFDVRGASVTVEPQGRRTLAVQVALTLAGGRLATGTSCHAEPFVAVSDAFRVASRALLQRGSRPPMA
ncbi:MAG TPA: hypothetical protein VLT45_10575 [Kofleriaceae bacterium]|nr:hypothetical protein [Kofleriaceae bacterium]